MSDFIIIIDFTFQGSAVRSILDWQYKWYSLIEIYFFLYAGIHEPAVRSKISKLSWSWSSLVLDFSYFSVMVQSVLVRGFLTVWLIFTSHVLKNYIDLRCGLTKRRFKLIQFILIKFCISFLTKVECSRDVTMTSSLCHFSCILQDLSRLKYWQITVDVKHVSVLKSGVLSDEAAIR